MSQNTQWKRKAFAPKGTVKIPCDKNDRGMFIIKGPNKIMPELWEGVEWETQCGELGYFANFSDESETIIIYHSCADDLGEKSKIHSQINMIKGALEVSVIHRKGCADSEDGSEYNAEEEEEVVIKKTVITTEETRKVTRASTKAMSSWRTQNYGNRRQYPDKSKSYRKF